MSIILKGIDMPKKGTNIVLTIYGRDGTYDAETYPSGPRIKDEAIQIHYEVEDIVDDVVENHELYKKGGWII